MARSASRQKSLARNTADLEAGGAGGIQEDDMSSDSDQEISASRRIKQSQKSGGFVNRARKLETALWEKPTFMKVANQISQSQEVLSDLHSSFASIDSLHSKLIDDSPTGTSPSRSLIDSSSLQELARLITSTTRQILITHKTVRGISRQFGLALSSSSGSLNLSKTDQKILYKSIRKLNSSLASICDEIEERAREEGVDVESGAVDKRMRNLMGLWTRKESKASLRDVKRLAEDYVLTKSGAGSSPVDITSYQARWALENPFTSIFNSTVQDLEKYQGIGDSTAVTESQAYDPPAETFGKSRAQYDLERQSALRNQHQNGKTSRRDRRLLSLASYYNLAQAPTPEKPIKSTNSARNVGSDSDNEASKQLLAPDGTKLPFHIPTDDPNDSETPSELLEDARAQVRREHIYVPLIIAFWIGIFCLVIYWGTMKLLGHENPLGDVNLAEHLGNTGWHDTSMASQTTSSSTELASTATISVLSYASPVANSSNLIGKSSMS